MCVCVGGGGLGVSLFVSRMLLPSFVFFTPKLEGALKPPPPAPPPPLPTPLIVEYGKGVQAGTG